MRAYGVGTLIAVAAACASVGEASLEGPDASANEQSDATVGDDSDVDSGSTRGESDASDAALLSPSFVVDLNHVRTPEGKRFYVKGVAFPYGSFTGDPALGVTNLKSANQELAVIRGLGFNLVRVFTYPETNVPALTAFVAEARRLGFVLEITGWHPVFTQNLPWMASLAERFRDDPYVWLEPANEPNCPGDACKDWTSWHTEHTAYVKAIREKGMRSPIVINTPNFSTDVSGIDAYSLNDSNLVYGIHRYGNDNPTFDAAERAKCEVWATLSSSHAMLIDEFGNYDGPARLNALAWTQGFVDYAREWTVQRGGVGANAFTWCWYDGNTMVGYEKGSAQDGGACDGKLTPWGAYFRANYLAPLEDGGL